MIVAEGASNFPGGVFVLPEMNELAFAHCLSVLVPRVVKAVNAHLHRSIALHEIDLQCPGNQFASHFTAYILLDAVGQVLPPKSYTALIVVELHVFYKEGAELLQITTVVGVEKRGIQ